MGSIPESGRSPGGETDKPFQYSCLGNPMDEGAWWAKSTGLQRVEHDLGSKQDSSSMITGQDVFPSSFSISSKGTCIHSPPNSPLVYYIEQSSLCYSVGLCWLSVLNRAVYMYVYVHLNFPNYPFPHPPPPHHPSPLVTVSSFSKSVSCICFVNKFIFIISF